MSASYKPALLKALVRIARSGFGPTIPLLRIGSEFVTLYWVQTIIFRLRQAPTVIAEPEVVRNIRTTADLSGVRRLNDLPLEARDRLDRKMAGVLTIDVLERFHNSAPDGMPRLYEWAAGDATVRLGEASHGFLRSNGHALETIANHWWARYLERVNMLAPLIIEKVERNGAERRSLTRYLKILRTIDATSCFYCERPLGPLETPHVDHVIPWSFLLSDPLWDLVLTCASCNLSKSDVLPAEHFLDRLAGRGLERAKREFPINFGSPMIAREELERYYAAAVSVEWPRGWEPPGVP